MSENVLTSTTTARASDISLVPTPLPRSGSEERGCSCIYCFNAPTTFVEPPARHSGDGVGAAR
ncbi:hypothetical protein [Streptomyces sp. NPDC048606]|uniref:hypothetical protein n=1 Tax=Streptomyces sp. NPDC048606 TaxID=3154726 RepID=UPI0034156358